MNDIHDDVLSPVVGRPEILPIQIVGLHLNAAGIPLFASAQVSFTVN